MMKIKGYDFVIRDLDGNPESKKVLGDKVVETWCISEEMCLRLIDKYCPLPPGKTLTICLITEGEEYEE